MKNHQAIQNEWEIIKWQLKTRSKINQFFQQISEIDENDTVPAMKPDLFGEFLFLHEWNELMDEQNDWLFDLLKQDYSRSFFAMCLSDWKEESKILLDLLSDQNADAEQLVACAVVLNLAVHKVHSEEERLEYTAKIKALDNERSAAILKEYVNAVRFIYGNGTNSISSKCMTWFNKINWTHYTYETDKDQLDYADACDDAGSIISQSLRTFYKASEYFTKALKIREKVLGTDHIDTAYSYDNISFFYTFNGMYDKAIECLIKALEVYERVLETDDPYISRTYNNIGSVYARLCDYDKAFEYYIKALEIQLEIPGTDPLLIQESYVNISDVLDEKGEYDKALEYYNKVLEFRKKEDGTDHPYTAASYERIGSIYYNKGEYDKALENYNMALAIYEKVYETDHRFTKNTQEKIDKIKEIISSFYSKPQKQIDKSK